MQEEINAIRDAYYPSDKTEEENKKLCERFPFLAWYGDPLYMGYSEDGEPNYKFTWEDEVPEGWRKAFCPQMWEELKEILAKADYINKFRFVQIKEKWGQLRLYYCGAPNDIYDEVESWISKYEQASEKTCIHCGKPAKYMSIGWISPWCEDCAKEIHDVVIKIEDAEDFYNTPREERKKFFVEFKK